MRNKILILIAALLALNTGTAYATPTCAESLGNLFTPFQRVQLCKVFGSATTQSLIPNADNSYDVGSTTFGWRTGYFDTSVITPKLNPATSLAVAFSGTTDATFTAGALTVATDGWTVQSNTADATDNKSVTVCGGGGCSGSRGGKIALYGNEESGGLGAVTLTGGAVSTGHINLVTGHASANIIAKPNGTTELTISPTGVTSAAGDYNFSTLGTVAIQEATAGTACSGTLTANGATPVVTSTTCATTGSRIFITRTSAETTALNAYISAISNGVSFSLTSEAGDTGTYNWFIIHEAP